MDDVSLKRQTDRFVEVSGIRLHYNDVGSGQVLLCTHGGGPGATAWGSLGPAVPALADQFRMLLLDLPNFGDSQKGITRGDTSPDVFLAHLSRAFLEAVGISEPVSYVSSSGGAPAALRFAIDFPQLVRKVVIQAFSPGMLPDRNGPAAGPTAEFFAEPSRAGMAKLFEFFVPNPARRTDAAIDARWAAASAPGHLDSREDFVRLTANSDITEALQTLTTEVLFVWGLEDGIVPVERVLLALKRVPHAEAHIWGDRTGHLVPFEHPEEFARVVTDFLCR